MGKRGTRTKFLNQYHHKGVSGISLLTKGLHRRIKHADPHAVLEVKGEHKATRRVRLRREPLGEVE